MRKPKLPTLGLAPTSATVRASSMVRTALAVAGCPLGEPGAAAPVDGPGERSSRATAPTTGWEELTPCDGAAWRLGSQLAQHVCRRSRLSRLASRGCRRHHLRRASPNSRNRAL